MTPQEFSDKYKDYLEEGHYGLALSKPEAVEYLDKEFQELIKIPGFTYSQIKSKFTMFRVYTSNVVSLEKIIEIEKQLYNIYNDTTDTSR